MQILKHGASVFARSPSPATDRVELHNQDAVSLAALIESTEYHLWAVGLDYRLTLFNRAFQQHIEESFHVRVAVGMRPEEMFPPERASAWYRFFERALLEGPFHEEYALASGQFFQMALNRIAVDGRTSGISIVGKDVSECKRAEQSLKEAERKFRDIFDGAVEGMFQSTLDGQLLTANRAIAKMLDYDSPLELLTSVKSLAEDVWADPAERSKYLQSLEARGGNSLLGYECRFKRKDGSTLWVSLNGRRVCDSEGRARFNEGFILDITDRKRSEETLRESAEALQEAQKIGGMSSYTLNVQAGLWTSSDLLDGLFGIGKNYDHSVAGWAALIHPDDRAMMAAYFADEVVKKGKPFDREYRIIRQKDQDVRWCHGLGRLTFDADGRPLKMRGMIRDITDRKQAEIRIRESEERYRQTFEQAAVGIVHTSFNGRFLRCNTRFSEIIGYPQEEVPELTFQQITAPDDLAPSSGVLHSMLKGDANTSSWEKRYLRKDGSLTWAKITVSTQRDADGHALHFITVVEDINARKTVEQRLAEVQQSLQSSEERYRTAFQTSLDAMSINRLSDGVYIDANSSFLRITGYEREELIGRSSLEIGIWADPNDRVKLIEELTRNSVCQNVETQFRIKDGTLIWALTSASLIQDDGVPGILTVTRDISEAKAAREQIASLAFYDTLTQLPNRHLLLERLRQSLAAGVQTNSQRALLIVDLDDFKTLNDTLGHQTGDLVLREVAQRIVACIREPDTVSRLGSDEFVVTLEELSEVPGEAAAQAEAVGEKILAAVGQPYHLAGRECRSTSSIGITVFGAQPARTNDVLQQADIALCQAKKIGGNTMRFFVPALQAAVNARAALEQDLRHGIEANQFVLYYQPQVYCNRWIGAEALIRWNHPRRGLIFPDEFIPLAEETGLILPLGNWVLRTACEQIAAWARGPEATRIRASVNISVRQFREPDFVQQVLTALDQTGADPQFLVLELTESILVNDVEDVIEKMTCLKSHGLRFSLDDFGTGYSSLSYLKRLPLDQLKIDRSFVRDILVDDSSGAIAQTILSLSQAMGLSVIAEGVETEEQRDFLSGLGCHSFQGYLFSRPLPLKDFEEMWADSALCAESLPQ